MKDFFKRYAGAVVSIFTAGYILFFSTVSILRYRAFDFGDFDLAIHAQTVWGILHGSIYSPILGAPFLGNHLNLILFLISPLYAVFPTPQTLLLLQALFIGLGVVPIYLLARDILDKKFATLFSLLYLTYPALNFVNYFEFHPVAFTMFSLLFMIYYFEKEKFLPFLCFMLLSLLCKENISLGVFFFGLYVLFFTSRGWKWSIIPLVVACFWFACALKIMPYLNQDRIGFSLIYSHLGGTIPQVVSNIFEHPGIILKLIFTGTNLKFLFQLLFPLAFLSLLSPKVLLISLPFFLQQLLSLRATDHTIYYHYAAKLIPFLFISAIYGLRFLLKSRFMNRRQWSLVGVLLTVSIVSNLHFGLLVKMFPRFSRYYTMEDIDYRKQDLIDLIPKDASVVATFEFLPQLSQRERVFSFHHVYTSRYTLSDKEYILPEDVDYALIDFNDPLTFSAFYMPERYRNLQNFFGTKEWGLITAVDNIALFKKGHETDLKLYSPLEEFTPSIPVRLFVEKNIGMEYNIANRKVRPGESVFLKFTWECLREVDKDYWVALKVVDKGGNVIHGYNHPVCYRIYPTNKWKKGDILSENCWMLIPPSFKGKEARIKMGVFDQSTRRSVPVEATSAGMFDHEGWINLGKIEIDINPNIKNQISK